MKVSPANSIGASVVAIAPALGGALDASSGSNCELESPRRAERATRGARLDECSDRWGRLMVAAQSGDSRAYECLLRELDAWLRSYYARRLPHPAAEDARQETLLAIHAKRHTFVASGSFGGWVATIARHKWIDNVRKASRYSAMSLDEDIPTEDHAGAAISAAALDRLLALLNPAQASAIRLVKLKGFSIARASGATGQSASLVKVNIHRGLRKLATLVSR